jgi:hypothetical protein
LFSSDRPKRLIIQHTARAVIGSDGRQVAADSGLWINGMDFIHVEPILR